MEMDETLNTFALCASQLINRMLLVHNSSCERETPTSIQSPTQS